MKSAELSAALARARLDIDDELRESRKIGAALRTSGEPAALDRRTRRVLKAQEALLDRMARPPAGEYVDVVRAHVPAIDYDSEAEGLLLWQPSAKLVDVELAYNFFLGYQAWAAGARELQPPELLQRGA